MQLLGLQESLWCQVFRDLVASGAGVVALLEFCSNLWQLVLKGPLWLVFLCCLAWQVLRDPPWLEFFSIA